MKNKYKIEGNTLIVYNRADNREMLFDTEDFDLIKDYTWRLDMDGYIRTQIVIGSKHKVIKAHRLIMGFPESLLIDHINHNTLDNRKENLRIVTNKINQHNQKSSKGYSWNKQVKKWKAGIRVNNKLLFLGYFETEAEAREAYLEAKKKYHPSAPQHLFV